MSILTILFKLWPAIKDTVFGERGLENYFKKHRVVMILMLSNIITFSSFVYIYEEAFQHGVISKSKTQMIIDLKSRIANGCK